MVLVCFLLGVPVQPGPNQDDSVLVCEHGLSRMDVDLETLQRQHVEPDLDYERSLPGLHDAVLLWIPHLLGRLRQLCTGLCLDHLRVHLLANDFHRHLRAHSNIEIHLLQQEEE
jgi:hypothetical protein